MAKTMTKQQAHLQYIKERASELMGNEYVVVVLRNGEELVIGSAQDDLERLQELYNIAERKRVENIKAENAERNQTTADRFGVSLEVVECLRDIETLTEEEAAEKYPADLLRQAEELGERETTAEDNTPAEAENEPQTTNTPQSDRNAATAELFAVNLEVVECLRDIETLTPEEAADKYPAGLLAQAEQLGQLEEWAEQSNPRFNRDHPTGTRAEMVETLQRFNPDTMARAAV